MEIKMTQKIQYTFEQVRARLLDELHDGERLVTFTKLNGERRVMRCTLNKKILSDAFNHGILSETVGSTRAKSVETISVYDMDKKDWRSFTIDRVQMCVPVQK